MLRDTLRDLAHELQGSSWRGKFLFEMTTAERAAFWSQPKEDLHPALDAMWDRPLPPCAEDTSQ